MKRYRFILFSFIISLGINLFLHQVDNKYEHNDIEAVCGVVDYTPSSSNFHFLTRQWAFYNNQLLTPNTVSEGQLTRYIDIGQFGGFELGDMEKSPHGQGTYRLRIFDTPGKVVTLQLPEIYSAYHLYVNGQLLYSSGIVEKENYEAKILSTDITFTTEELNEIIIQVSDYDHYYSGMIYPIAYGTNQQINIYETIQVLIKGLQSFLPLVMFIVCLFSYFLSGKNKKDIYFALVCLSYLGYVLYGIIHLLIVSQSFLWYLLEDICYYLLMFTVCLLILHQYGYKIRKRYILFASLILIASIIIPSLLVGTEYQWIYILSRMGKLYKIVFTLLMGGLIYKNNRKQEELFSKVLLAGVIFFVVSVNMDNVFWYEPILFGWGTEIAGFLLIGVFAVSLLNDKFHLYQQYHLLTHQQSQMKEYIFDVAHDLKAPTASINGYIELINSGMGKKLNKEEYLLNQMANKIEVLSKRVALLQTLDIDSDMTLQKEEVSILELVYMIKEKYEILLEDKHLLLDVVGEDYLVVLDKEKMFICIENLLMNAIEYSKSHGTITIELLETKTSYQIHVINKGRMIPEDKWEHIFERHYTTGEKSHSGLGLAICKKIVNAHMGEIKVESNPYQTIFKVILYKK